MFSLRLQRPAPRNGFWHLCTSAALMAVPSLSGAAATTSTVTIDHKTEGSGVVEVVKLKKGDSIKIVVKNTSKECFAFNLRTLVSITSALVATPPTDEVQFSQTYDNEAGYQVRAEFRDDLSPNQRSSCAKELSERIWEIQVQRESWALSVNGAFTADKLTARAYFLEAGSRSVTDSQGQTSTEQGYFVRRNQAAEDKYSLGAAAMVHLYHEKMFGTGFKWAPISFGLGVSGDSQARYYFGTSAAFGTKLYLTGGRVVGSVTSLPANLAEDGFTTDQNALAGRVPRTDKAWFLAVSISIADVDLSAAFKKPFAQPSPNP